MHSIYMYLNISITYYRNIKYYVYIISYARMARQSSTVEFDIEY